MTVANRPPAEASPSVEAVDPNRYNHAEVEPRWPQSWAEHETLKAVPSSDLSREKRYVLDMFPYPSGSGLHVGHPEGYTATDILSRFWRTRGTAVLPPRAGDALALPAEQYAIQTGTRPETTTKK